MRSRIILFVVLAVVAALVGVYVGRSTNTPKAVGEPATATPADSSVGPTQGRIPRSGPARPPTASPPKASPPKPKPPKAIPPKATPSASPAPPTGPVRFGKVTTTPSGDTALLDVAKSDRRALTAAFSDREVAVGDPGLPVATRSFAMAMPLTVGGKGDTLRVYVQGYAFVEERAGAYARLTLKLNGQSTVKYYPSGFDHEVYEVLELPATPGTAYQLSGVIEALRKPGSSGHAYLQVQSIDASIS